MAPPSPVLPVVWSALVAGERGVTIVVAPELRIAPPPEAEAVLPMKSVPSTLAEAPSPTKTPPPPTALLPLT